MEIQEDKLRLAADAFNNACRDILAEKEAQEYTGWDREDMLDCIVNRLEGDAYSIKMSILKCDTDSEITSELNSKKLIDIANRAMMLWYQSTKGGKQ